MSIYQIPPRDAHKLLRGHLKMEKAKGPALTDQKKDTETPCDLFLSGQCSL